MATHSFTIATITLARTVADEKGLIRALGLLKGHSVITADGGSRPRFIEALHKIGLQILCPNENGLVPQIKSTLRAALDASDTPYILYTEPDKWPFFDGKLDDFVAQALRERPAPVTFAARDRKSFATFPAGQRRCEAFMNESAAMVLGKEGDYCYGPLLLTRAAAELAQEAPDHLGWGWRFWLLGRAAQKKLKFRTIEMPLVCPDEQREEDSRQDQIYRLKQLRQNLEGLSLGLGLPL